MSKKHLEEIIDKWDYAFESGRDGSYLSVEDVEYLIEQAERVEELEERVKEYEINIIENGVDIFKMTKDERAMTVCKYYLIIGFERYVHKTEISFEEYREIERKYRYTAEKYPDEVKTAKGNLRINTGKIRFIEVVKENVTEGIRNEIGRNNR